MESRRCRRAPRGTRSRPHSGRGSVLRIAWGDCALSTQRLFAAIHRDWVDPQVLLFSGQVSDRCGLIAQRDSGRSTSRPPGERRASWSGLSELYVVSNVIEKASEIGTPAEPARRSGHRKGLSSDDPTRRACSMRRDRPERRHLVLQHVTGSRRSPRAPPPIRRQQP